MGVPLPALPPRDEARARLGLARDAFVVVSLGHVTPYKRLDVALRAFRRLLVARPDARFLIAGSGAEAPNLGLERQIGYLGLDGCVARLRFRPPRTAAPPPAPPHFCGHPPHPLPRQDLAR